MQRILVEPADVSDAPLFDLKNWLGITRANEDEMLQGLLLASLEVCEAYTGQTLLSQVVEERLPARAERFDLHARPVISLVSVEAEFADGRREPLNQTEYTFCASSARGSSIEVASSGDANAIFVRMQVGIGQSWEQVPPALRQGVIKLAAEFYRSRDATATQRRGAPIPDGIAAIWQPWRDLRLR